jgi:uncharacterized protein
MNTSLESEALSLHDAIHAEKIREVEIIIRSGADIHRIDDWAVTPLEHAVEVGNIKIIKILLDAGANMYFGIGRTPFEEAINIARIDIMQVFIDAKIDLNKKLENGWSFLITAIINRNLDIVKFLVEKGANINVVRSDGKSALICAATWGGLEIFNYLFELSSSEIREQTIKEMADNLIIPELVNNQLAGEVLF